MIYLQVNPASGLKFHYSLIVDDIPFEQFKQRQSKALRTWEQQINDKTYRVVLGEFCFYMLLRPGGWCVKYVTKIAIYFGAVYAYIEKDTLNVYLNGIAREEQVSFCAVICSRRNIIKLNKWLTHTYVCFCAYTFFHVYRVTSLMAERIHCSRRTVYIFCWVPEQIVTAEKD